MEKKEHLLQTALSLFCKKGYKGTSIRDIAAEANVNVAMVNYYFKSKEGLFEKAIEYRASSLKAIFTDLFNNDSISAIEKIDIIIDKTIERKFSDSGFHHLLHRELALNHTIDLRERISEILMKNLTPVKIIVQNGIDSGEFKKVDVELTLATIIGTIHYLLTSETMARRILGKRSDFNPFTNKKLKERLGEHLKQLVHAHLLK